MYRFWQARLWWVAVALFGAALLGACSSGKSQPSEAAGPTYYEDVAPLLNQSCVGCHRDGGIAPFALTDYAAVRDRAADIVQATAAREMPPMPVNDDGSCNTYSNARWLSDEQILMLRTWQQTGAAAGNPANAPALPDPPPSLSAPDATLDLGAPYTPSSPDGHDDYRCFVLPSPVDHLAYLTEYEVLPGDPRVVHHVIVYQPASDDEAKAAHALDDAASGAGYPCFGGAGVDASPVALWGPGAGAIALPSGTGVPLVPGRDLIVQIHYNLNNGAFPDRTRVALSFATAPVISAQYLAVANQDLRLEPGQAKVESMATMTTDGTRLKVYGAMPHMHTLGRTLHVDAEANGASRCLVDVDRWDFHWQNAWWYDTPLVLENTTSIAIRCGFDTTTEDHVVTWGESTSDEMCISFFYVTTKDAPDPVVSCTDSQNPLFGSCLDDLLSGCFAPDLSGTCSSGGGTVSWSDGTKLVTTGSNPGLYSPGSQDPCITLALASGSAQLTKGTQQLSYTATGGNVTVQCPNQAQISATSSQLAEYEQCRGLTCPG